MTKRKNGYRFWALAIVGALALTACRVPGQWFPGHGIAKPSGVHIVAPTNATQASASGEVAVDVRVENRLDPASLKVSVVIGWPVAVSLTPKART